MTPSLPLPLSDMFCGSFLIVPCYEKNKYDKNKIVQRKCFTEMHRSHRTLALSRAASTGKIRIYAIFNINNVSWAYSNSPPFIFYSVCNLLYSESLEVFAIFLSADRYGFQIDVSYADQIFVVREQCGKVEFEDGI